MMGVGEMSAKLRRNYKVCVGGKFEKNITHTLFRSKILGSPNALSCMGLVVRNPGLRVREVQGETPEEVSPKGSGEAALAPLERSDQ